MGEFREHIERLSTDEGWKHSFPVLEQAGKAAVHDILLGMEHRDWRIRKWCVALMDHNADDACIEALVRRLNDTHADVRRHAVHSIGCQSCKGSPLCLDIVPLLAERALHDRSIRVRRSAAHMLGNQRFDPRAVLALTELLAIEQDRKMVSNAAWSLKQQQAREVQHP